MVSAGALPVVKMRRAAADETLTSLLIENLLVKL
jgi:hypothetical protein